MGLLRDVILLIQKTKHLLRCAQGLLKTVVEGSEFADRIIEFENGHDEGEKCSVGERTAFDLITSYPQQKRDGNGPDNVHERRTDCLRCHQSQIGLKEFSCRSKETGTLPAFHAKGFYNAIAGDCLMQNVLD